jgi:hypothetical protein
MKPAKKPPMPTPFWMEPMLPADGSRALEDVAFDLISSANALAGQIHPIVAESVGNLVRSMNCYYSNLIEGHDTHPRDIDRALHKDYSTEPRKRALQLEAVAHIEVQKAIDEGEDPKPHQRYSARPRRLLRQHGEPDSAPHFCAHKSGGRKTFPLPALFPLATCGVPARQIKN